MKAFEIWQSISNSKQRKLLEELLHEYHTKPHAELNELPEMSTISKKTVSKNIRINIYRNNLEEGVIEIIIQLYIPGKNLFVVKFAEVESTGFRVSPNGETENVPNEVIYGYM